MEGNYSFGNLKITSFVHPFYYGKNGRKKARDTNIFPKVKAITNYLVVIFFVGNADPLYSRDSLIIMYAIISIKFNYNFFCAKHVLNINT